MKMLAVRLVTSVILLVSVAGFFSFPVLAQTPPPNAQNDTTYGLGTTGGQAGFPVVDAQTQLNFIVGKIINVILGLTGVIFMILIVWAGDLWMTADGNEEKISKARGMLFNAAIGLIITFTAYIGSHWLVDTVLTAVGI